MSWGRILSAMCFLKFVQIFRQCLVCVEEIKGFMVEEGGISMLIFLIRLGLKQSFAV